ncbi:MAG TPA: efflux RND transporter periplasmic adaptor subunit [Kofleriaceae bacterium]|jgi:RND family efflux transporter MFP subunit
MKRAIVLVLCALVACGKSADKSGGKATGGRHGSGAGGGKEGAKLEYPVDVATLEARKLVYSVTAPGTIDAFQEVQLTARVAGAVDKVTFVEGQDVKKGDTLAVIENDRYQIAVEQSKSALARANATQKSAEAALERRVSAQKESPGLVPGEEIEQKQTAVDTAKADVSAAQQDLRVAELNLRDSVVKASVDGTVQTRTVQQGQYLQPGAVLGTIIQAEPLLLRFSVTEQDAPRLHPGMTANLLLKESPREFTAKITLVAGAADPATRTVPVTAQIDTSSGHKYWLRPGAFCTVTVPIGDAREGIVVPSLAVQPTEKGNVVYVIDSGNIAHEALVQLGMHTADGGVELTRGVSVGQVIAVRGIEPLAEGAPVKINSKLTLDQASAPPDGGVPNTPAPPPTGPIDGEGSGNTPGADAPTPPGAATPGAATPGTPTRGPRPTSAATGSAGAPPPAGTAPASGAAPKSPAPPKSPAALPPSVAPSTPLGSKR